MLTRLGQLYTRHREALATAAATTIGNALPSFESTFAPIPPPPGLSGDTIEEIIAGVTFLFTIVSAGAFNGGMSTFTRRLLSA